MTPGTKTGQPLPWTIREGRDVFNDPVWYLVDGEDHGVGQVYKESVAQQIVDAVNHRGRDEDG